MRDNKKLKRLIVIIIIFFIIIQHGGKILLSWVGRQKKYVSDVLSPVKRPSGK